MALALKEIKILNALRPSGGRTALHIWLQYSQCIKYAGGMNAQPNFCFIAASYTITPFQLQGNSHIFHGYA